MGNTKAATSSYFRDFPNYWSVGNFSVTSIFKPRENGEAQETLRTFWSKLKPWIHSHKVTTGTPSCLNLQYKLFIFMYPIFVC